MARTDGGGRNVPGPNNTRKDRKPTNPKDALGIAKVPFSTLPAEVTAEVGLAMLEGALKYGRHNYRAVGVRASVYYDAAMRHLSAWWEGQDIDPASGIHHVSKAVAGLMVLRDSMTRGNWTDDRPPKTPAGWVEALNAKAKELLARYPTPEPAFTEIEHGAEMGSSDAVVCSRAPAGWTCSRRAGHSGPCAASAVRHG